MPTPRTLILYNEPTLAADHPDADAESDILYTADCVAKCLADAGVPVARLGVTDDPAAVLAGLQAHAPDVVFNLYEGTAAWGNTEAFVSGMLELLRLPFTGSPTQPLLLARNKPLTKHLLAGAGLPTAPFLAVEALPVPECPFDWPVIVKPGKEDASVGIDQKSVVTSQEQLDERVKYILEAYGPPVLIEQFVRGREFNVAVWDDGSGPRTLPFSEILFLDQDKPDALWPIVSFDAKWRPSSRDFQATPAKNPAEHVSAKMQAEVSRLAIRAFELVGCRDYARVDFRVDESGKPFILEVNPNPCISPLAGLAAALETAKVPYSEFIVSLARSAAGRGGQRLVSKTATPTVELHESATTGWRVRSARGTDAGNLYDLITACDAWSPDERKQAARVLRERFRRRGRGGATILVLAGRGRVGGFAVLAPANPAQGAFVVELLVIDLAQRQTGLGRQLLAAVEEAASSAGGRMLTADVSSGPPAVAPRHLLTRCGYRAAGEVIEFYKDGSARLTFAKSLPVVVPVPQPVAVSGATA